MKQVGIFHNKSQNKEVSFDAHNKHSLLMLDMYVVTVEVISQLMIVLQ